MEIQTNDKYPVESQRNKTIHVPKEVGVVAVWRGEATEVKYKSYVDRLKAAAAAPKAVHAADNSVAPPTLKVGWGIVTRDGPGGQKYFVQQVTAAGETFLYDGPPASAPATIVAQYQELSGGNVDPAIAAEAARVAKCERDNAALANTELETKGYHRIFGGR